jgi:hypothetical protein
MMDQRELRLYVPKWKTWPARPYGGVLDNEMLMALPPNYLPKAITGMEALAKTDCATRFRNAASSRMCAPVRPSATPAAPAKGHAMRLGAPLLALLAMSGIAHADEARNVPAAGSKLTYRSVTTTTIPRATLTTGEEFTYIVTAGDATSAEGIIKPRARIVQCKEDDTDLYCKSAAARPGAHFDGGLLTIPIASDIGDALAKESDFKYAYFIQENRKFAVPGVRDPQHSDPGDFIPEPAYILTNTYHCDFARLAGFLASGTTAHVTLPCETIFERTASRDGQRPALTTHNKVSVDIRYIGDGSVTLPSGNWQVKKLAFKMTPEDPSHLGSEGESLFSPQLGVIVKTHRIGENPSTHSKSENTTELISVEP